MTYKSVTLKVCEGCGTLWIRKEAKAGVYCAPCATILQQFPDPKTRLRPGRPRKHREEGYEAGPGVPACLPGMAAAGISLQGMEEDRRQDDGGTCPLGMERAELGVEGALGAEEDMYQDNSQPPHLNAYGEPYRGGYEGVTGGVQ